MQAVGGIRTGGEDGDDLHIGGHGTAPCLGYIRSDLPPGRPSFITRVLGVVVGFGLDKRAGRVAIK